MQQPGTPAAILPKIKAVCDVLARDSLLTADQIETAFARISRTSERIEEALLELGFLAETDMLKSLATYYKAYFISSEKLARADVPRALLDMIPQRFAEQIGICPVLFDPKSNSLSVVTADPDDLESLREAQLASGVREVKPVLARPAAVRALIAKVYSGDIHAFATLDRQASAQLHHMLHVYERGNLVIDGATGTPPRTEPRARERPVPDEATRTPASKPAKQPKSAPMLVAAPAAAPDKGVSGASFVELLHVLVSLLETSRGDLRGHSAHVARLMRRMAEKLGMDPGATAVLVAAGFIHDLGKMGSLHLTTLNCNEYDGHKIAAQKACGVPPRLLEPVRLPKDTIEAVAHMYERYDGKGFPVAMNGKDIPLGARLLSICDTYADLTSNSRNPFRRTLMPKDACAALAKHKELIFDPNLVDLFRNTVLGEELAARLLSSRSQALVVDVDPEETTVLELRMSEQGFVVKPVRTAEQALKVLAEGETDLVISEIDLAQSGDGLTLLAEARAQPWGKDVPWVVYTRRQERATAQRAFELGVLDYVTKPAPADVLVAKLKALLEQRASSRATQGVSGSLREMGLPDMVQVLFHGRKTGNLRIRAREGSGEIHFVEGNVVDALWRDVRAEEAFFAMLAITDGDFALDPTFRASSRVIHQSSEALLLEGMRRMDEGLA